MNYLLNKIEKEGFAEFLLNPYSKVACLEDFIFQKYQNDLISDDIYMISEKSLTLYGRVYYDKKEIIKRISIDGVDSSLFISTSQLRDELKVKMRDDLEAMKAPRKAEVKSSTQYKDLIRRYKEKYFQLIFFEMLGAIPLFHDLEDGVSKPISKFVNYLKLDTLCDIKYGNLELVNKEIEKIFMSESFLVRQILFEEIKEEVKAAIDAGVFTERQRHLQNIIKKTKAVDCVNFLVHTETGLKLGCRNMILTDGTVFMSSKSIVQSVDFESIQKIISKGKIIYEKGIF